VVGVTAGVVGARSAAPGEREFTNPIFLFF
jgi:hypothetical protein